MFSLSLAIFASISLGSPQEFHASSYKPTRSYAVMRQQSYKNRNVKKSLSLPWKGNFLAKNYKSSADKIQLNEIKKSLRGSILKIPRSHTQSLKSLEIRNQKHASRGLANAKKIILNTASISDENELQAVFIHELGHVVDLGKLKGNNGKTTEFWDGKIPIYSDDVSLRFYRQSWKKSDERKNIANRKDFVSGYAMSSSFEDFAETYIFYRLHGEKFRVMAQGSKTLQAKYNFMKTYVFGGIEYQKGKKSENFIQNLIWDATLVKF